MATDKGFFNYCVVASSGKGFITHTDHRKFDISGYPGNVWVCYDIPESRDWVARNSGSVKTKSQAQPLLQILLMMLKMHGMETMLVENLPQKRLKDWVLSQ